MTEPDPTDRRAGDGGFSLVETIVALLIFTFGVMSLASATAHIVRQTTLADLLTERSVAFQTAIDRIQSLPYDSVVSGSDSVGVFELQWTVTPQGAQNKLVRIYTTGPGLSAGPFPANNPMKVDSFDFRILRR